MKRRIHASLPAPAAPARRRAAPSQPAVMAMKAMRVEDVRALQAAAGNRVARGALGTQRSMQVGAAGDAFEREADAVAREFMSNPNAAPQRQAEEEEPLHMKRVQRAAAEEEEPLQMKRVQRAAAEEEEPLQMKRVQRAAAEEEEPLQMKRVQRAAPEVGLEGGPASTGTAAAIEGARGGGRPLPAGVRREMEAHFGADFSGVRMHSDARAADLNDRLSARAFTTGSDIFVGREGLDPGSRGGKELLAHELTHVVQQGAAGRAVRRRR